MLPGFLTKCCAPVLSRSLVNPLRKRAFLPPGLLTEQFSALPAQLHTTGKKAWVCGVGVTYTTHLSPI